jgi:hypothetical protein
LRSKLQIIEPIDDREISSPHPLIELSLIVIVDMSINHRQSSQCDAELSIVARLVRVQLQRRPRIWYVEDDSVGPVRITNIDSIDGGQACHSDASFAPTNPNCDRLAIVAFEGVAAEF